MSEIGKIPSSCTTGEGQHKMIKTAVALLTGFAAQQRWDVHSWFTGSEQLRLWVSLSVIGASLALAKLFLVFHSIPGN